MYAERKPSTDSEQTAVVMSKLRRSTITPVATTIKMNAAVAGGFTIATTPVPLQNVATAWSLDNSLKRTVFTLG